MGTQTIDADKLSVMFLCGANRLEKRKDYINELNVFPVPDGDTGTNMSLTIHSAVDEIRKIEHVDMATVCKAISSGSLRGARGNSGVILSQLFRGFTKSIRDLDEIGVKEIAAAFMKAQETAYKAVMKPKEGTILTVARETSEKAKELSETTEDLTIFFEGVIAQAEETLKKTPELLPVLKEAGVVDSGGQGLVEVLKGAFDAYTGKETEIPEEETVTETVSKESLFTYKISFRVLINRPFSKGEEEQIRSYLLSIGDSVSFEKEEKSVTIGVQTNDPGIVLQKGISYGAITDISIKNMKLSASEAEEKPDEPAILAEKKDVAFVVVSAGDGLNEIFKQLGADIVVTGGQTMNPSTDDILSAIEHLNADHIVILPNNKNIILAANQAKAMKADMDLIVIPTKTIPQGISAMIGFEPGVDISENEASMNEIIENVRTGQVTYAVRDTSINGIEIHEGDFMGIDDAGIENVGDNPESVTLSLLEKMIDEDSELISIYYGEDTKKEDAEHLVSSLEEKWPDCDVECSMGGQPVYRYLVSVE